MENTDITSSNQRFGVVRPRKPRKPSPNTATEERRWLRQLLKEADELLDEIID